MDEKILNFTDPWQALFIFHANIRFRFEGFEKQERTAFNLFLFLLYPANASSRLKLQLGNENCIFVQKMAGQQLFHNVILKFRTKENQQVSLHRLVVCFICFVESIVMAAICFRTLYANYVIAYGCATRKESISRVRYKNARNLRIC